MKACTLLTAMAMGMALALSATAVQAKLPAPSDEAKAKAAEAAAKTAHTGKVDGYKLCLSMDRVAKGYYEQVKKEGKASNPATATAPCADPGVFVYAPPAPASAPASAPAAVMAAAPAAPAAPAASAAKK